MSNDLYIYIYIYVFSYDVGDQDIPSAPATAPLLNRVPPIIRFPTHRLRCCSTQVKAPPPNHLLAFYITLAQKHTPRCTLADK